MLEHEFDCTPARRARRSAIATAVLLCLGIATAPASGDVQSASAPESQIERGLYLAIAGNCGSCHTVATDKTMAGGVAFATPFGTLYSTNITPDPDTGIGNWTGQQFQQAMRSGVRPDGTHLYPAFPYTAFTKMTDEDIAAVFAYLKSLPPVKWTPPENDMPFPFNRRGLMSPWKTMFFEAGVHQPDPSQSAEWNRGQYLVEGPGHCGACHTPRNFVGAEKSSMAFAGGTYTDKVPSGELRTWSAVNLTSSSTGLAAWSVDDLFAYLKTGRSSRAISFGPMNEVIVNSTRHLKDEDVRAMAVYLKSLPAREHSSGSKPSADELKNGKTAYTLHCGTCHLPTGAGSSDTGPPLVGSAIVQASDPSTLINMITYGPHEPVDNRWDPMPAFGDKLDDDEIANLASYIRNSWGNEAGAVSEKQVMQQR